MNTFTIRELEILHECVKKEIRTTENTGIGYECVLEHLADKCVEAKIDASYKHNLSERY